MARTHLSTDQFHLDVEGIKSKLNDFDGVADKVSAATSITGSRGGNAALANLLTALATAGIITDNTTA